MQNTPFLTFRSSNAIISAASLFFDRLAFYGLRSIIILYLLDRMNWQQNTVYEVYGYIFLFSAFFALIGGVIGDLTKNKIISIISLSALIIACLLIAIPNDISVIAGLVLLFVFEKMNGVNIKSIFAREHLKEDASLDAGFTFLYLIINLGAFLGVLLVGTIAEEFSFEFGFISAAIAYGFALTLTFFLKLKDPRTVHTPEMSLIRRWLIPIFVAAGICAFWGVYELNFSRVYMYVSDIFSDLESLDQSKKLSLLQSVPTILFAIFLFLIWSFLKFNSLIKKTFGFIFALVALAFLFQIPESPDPSHKAYLYSALVLIALAELLIAPIAEAILARHISAKWLATAFAALYFIMAISNMIASAIQAKIAAWNIDIPMICGMIIYILLAIGFAVVACVIYLKKLKTVQSK